ATLFLPHLGLGNLVNPVTEWLASGLLVGLVLTFIAEDFVEKISGSTLKKYFLIINIKGHKFPISLFLIATIIAKLILFQRL
ncbi:MAG: hypothetical protein AABY11_03475, partial [archaeon]